MIKYKGRKGMSAEEILQMIIKIIDEEEYEEYIVAYIIDLLMEAGYYDRSISS